MIENQLTTEKASRLLQKAGLSQTSIHYYLPYYMTDMFAVKKVEGALPPRQVRIVAKRPQGIDVPYKDGEENMKPVSAWLTGELFDRLPAQILSESKEHPIHQLSVEKLVVGYHVGYICVQCRGSMCSVIDNSLPEALATTYLYLINQKLVHLTKL